MKIRVNPDKELVAEIRAAIKANNGHCCCESIQTDDNKCMCKAFRDQMNEGKLAFCHCLLYEIVND